MMANRAESAGRTFSQDPVGSALIDLMADIEHVEGDVREISNKIAKNGAMNRKGWPDTERGMAGALRRLISGAATSGIDIKELKTDPRTRRKRFSISRRGIVR
jgi:hypothetical protein